MVFPVIFSFLSGLLVAFITGMLLSVKKAKRLPGGSFFVGYFTGVLELTFGEVSWVIIPLCGIFGFLGWAAYVLFKREPAYEGSLGKAVHESFTGVTNNEDHQSGDCFAQQSTLSAEPGQVDDSSRITMLTHRRYCAHCGKEYSADYVGSCSCGGDLGEITLAR